MDESEYSQAFVNGMLEAASILYIAILDKEEPLKAWRRIIDVADKYEKEMDECSTP